MISLSKMIVLHSSCAMVAAGLSKKESDDLRQKYLKDNGITRHITASGEKKFIYCYDESVSDRLKIGLQVAFSELTRELGACIKFEEVAYNSGTQMCVGEYGTKVTEKDGCFAHLGKCHSGCVLSVQKTCLNGIVSAFHELAHSMGLHHEHARPEREQYIQKNGACYSRGYIFESNIDHFPAEISEYDVESATHYGPRSMVNYRTAGCKESFTCLKNPKACKTIYRIPRFSRGDIDKISWLYECPRVDLKNVTTTKEGRCLSAPSDTNEHFANFPVSHPAFAIQSSYY